LYDYGHARHITSNSGVSFINAGVTMEKLRDAIDFSMYPWYNSYGAESPNGLPRAKYSPIAIDLSGSAYSGQNGRPNPPWGSGADSIGDYSKRVRAASNEGNPYGYMFFYGLNPSSVGLATTSNGARNRTKEEYLSEATKIIFGMDTILTAEGGDFRKEW
jgi:hypothetical protein